MPIAAATAIAAAAAIAAVAAIAAGGYRQFFFYKKEKNILSLQQLQQWLQ